MTLEEIGELFDRIAECYPHFSADVQKMQTWHAILKGITFQTALDNLYRHVEDPANKFPPHPGALMADRDRERYHEYMRDAGRQALSEFELMRSRAVPPTDEQRRRVREALGKIG